MLALHLTLHAFKHRKAIFEHDATAAPPMRYFACRRVNIRRRPSSSASRRR